MHESLPADMQVWRATHAKEVSERLLRCRVAMKLTQARLSEDTGISTALWNNNETGRARMGLDTAIQFCNATGWTLDYIYRGTLNGLSEPFRQAIKELDRFTADELKKKYSGKVKNPKRLRRVAGQGSGDLDGA